MDFPPKNDYSIMKKPFVKPPVAPTGIIPQIAKP